MLRKKDRIISAVKQSNARYIKRTHNFGIEVPKTVEEAIALDENNGDTLWKKSNAKEMKNVREAFKIFAEGGNPLPGYHKIRCHMIFHINIKDFRRKTRLVSGGHVAEPADTIIYVSVVSRETVHIALTVAA